MLRCFPYIVFVLLQCFPIYFLKNYLYRIYFFNIELADNLTLAFPICLFYFILFFSKLSFFTYFLFFVLFFLELFFLFYFFTIELVEILVFLSFSLKHCSFPHVFFFFAFVSFFVHFFLFLLPKIDFFFLDSLCRFFLYIELVERLAL